MRRGFWQSGYKEKANRNENSLKNTGFRIEPNQILLRYGVQMHADKQSIDFRIHHLSWSQGINALPLSLVVQLKYRMDVLKHRPFLVMNEKQCT